MPSLATKMMEHVLPHSLHRRDQLSKGEQYVGGLLAAEGRKTMRNIAALVGGSAAEQSMHHFISASTWDWRPAREALAHYLQRSASPRAWVVRPYAIPKVGDWSVGVDSWGGRQAGAPSTGQYAYGLWSASDELSVPVNWRLFLSDRWTEDQARRRRAGIPTEVISATPEECAAASVLEPLRSWQMPSRPVVFDVPGADARRLVTGFDAISVPLIARAGSLTGCEVAAPAMPGFGSGPLTARQILESVKGLRREAEWTDHASGRRHTSLAMAIPVTLPGRVRGTARQGFQDQPRLLLVGEWEDPLLPPTHIWLTDLTRTPVPELLRLTKLSGRVAHEAESVGAEVGLRDFEGRSFGGWHRHMTLASVAHAVAALSEVTRPRARISTSVVLGRRVSAAPAGRRPVRAQCAGSGSAAAQSALRDVASSPASARRAVR
ncbi:IS701 family transposase [Streptomyces durmitorensis]|uniref:IS701 family transposase n=1 Tax=Streptomyces durmitorensis TaxID=319947 RepID=UPI003CD09E7A